MIKYDTDGATLIDGRGNKITVYDQPRYSEAIAVLDLQVAADKENAHSLDLYKQALAIAQTSVDAGRYADPPHTPLKHLVDDAGVSTYVSFDSLPALVYPTVTHSTGAIVTPTVDKMAIMQAQVDAIFRKLFPAA
jgi:hypothetical protein